MAEESLDKKKLRSEQMAYVWGVEEEWFYPENKVKEAVRRMNEFLDDYKQSIDELKFTDEKSREHLRFCIRKIKTQIKIEVGEGLV